MKKFSAVLFFVLLLAACYSQTENQNFVEVTENTSGLQFGDIYHYIFYPAEGILVLTLISFWIYHLVTAKKRVNSVLKENIEKLRNEEIDSEPVKGLAKFRSSLLKKVKNLDRKKKINEARKHEIATGEIDLALKLKSIIKS